MDVAVVGAGLVGSLLAVYLARRGLDVDVFERRPDVRATSTAGRSINLNLSTRGIRALRQVGLDAAVLAQSVSMTGRLIHLTDGTRAYQPYGRDASEHGNSVSRGALNRLLVEAADATGRVRFHFAHAVASAGEIDAGRVFAADGSGSAIRQSMPVECTVSPLDYGYKELTLAAAAVDRSRGGFRMEKNALHIWPRGRYMLIALPNTDGSFTCTLFLPYDGDPGFSSLENKGDAHLFFSEQFPDFAALVPDCAEQFLASPTGHMETVRCRPWHAGNVLLLGDAAHGVVPFYGQGMNAGFEDLRVLNECLDGNDQFAHFESLRRPNTDAVADMALENFIEMRDKCADPRFLLEKAAEKILEHAFPGEYVSRYALVTFTNIPYSVAQAAGRAADRMLAELCRGLSRPQDVDLARARELIARDFAPLLAPHRDEIRIASQRG